MSLKQTEDLINTPYYRKNAVKILCVKGERGEPGLQGLPGIKGDTGSLENINPKFLRELYGPGNKVFILFKTNENIFS
jgi:hypothetical protein